MSYFVCYSLPCFAPYSPYSEVKGDPAPISLSVNAHSKKVKFDREELVALLGAGSILWKYYLEGTQGLRKEALKHRIQATLLFCSKGLFYGFWSTSRTCLATRSPRSNPPLPSKNQWMPAMMRE